MEPLKLSNVVQNMSSFLERIVQTREHTVLVKHLKEIQENGIFDKHQSLVCLIIDVFTKYPIIFDGYTDQESTAIQATVDKFGTSIIAQKLIESHLKFQQWDRIKFVNTISDPNEGISENVMIKAKKKFMSMLGSTEYLYHETNADSVDSILKTGLQAPYNYFGFAPTTGPDGEYNDGVLRMNVKVKISEYTIS